MKKSFSIAFLIVGAIIGAGFASGREIRSFFALYGTRALPFMAAVFFLLLFCSTTYLYTGRLYRPSSFSDITQRIFKRGAPLVDLMTVTANFVFMAAMLAAYDSLGRSVFGFSDANVSLSVVALFLCAAVVLRGVKGLSKINGILVPVIVVFLITVCTLSIKGSGGVAPTSYGETSDGRIFFNCVLFVFGNLFSCAGVLYSAGKNEKKRVLFAGGLIASFVLCALILLLILAMLCLPPAVFNADLPIIFMSEPVGAAAVSLAVITLVFAIFTSLICNMFNVYEWWIVGISKNKYSAIIIIAALAFSLRGLGFNLIVDALYPIIGAFGLLFTLADGVYIYREHFYRDRRASLIKTRSKKDTK
jgi:uncharacterized membrane protein YkvI